MENRILDIFIVHKVRAFVDYDFSLRERSDRDTSRVRQIPGIKKHSVRLARRVGGSSLAAQGECVSFWKCGGPRFEEQG